MPSPLQNFSGWAKKTFAYNIGGLFSRHTHFSHRQGLPEKLNFAALVAPGIMLGKDGSFTAGWLLTGKDLTSRTEIEKDLTCEALDRALARLDSGWMIHHHALRVPTSAYPSSPWPDQVTQAIDAERRAYFEAEGHHFQTILALTVTYKPPPLPARKFQEMMFVTVGEGDDDAKQKLGGKHLDRRTILENFEGRLKDLEDALSCVFHPRRMTSFEHTDAFGVTAQYDDMLQFVSACVNGREHPIQVPPESAMYLDSLIGTEDFTGGVEPRVGDQEIVALSIDGFPSFSYANILDGLDRMPIPMRWTTRFIFLDTAEALKQLKDEQKLWEQGKKTILQQVFNTGQGKENLDAVEMAGEVAQAIAETTGGLIHFGYYTSSLIFQGTNRQRALEYAREAKKIIEMRGFNCRIETVNAVETWLGSMPSEGRADLRRGVIHTRNLSHLVPVTTLWTGAPVAPCPFYPRGSPPLMICPSEGSTPFNFNLHVGDVGHTLIVGPTGSGKSTLLATLVAQFRRYPGAQVFAFDKGYSMLPICCAVGGEHYDIAGGNDQSFCPLGTLTPEDADGISWAAEWVADMIVLTGEEMTPDRRKAILNAVKQVANQKDQAHQTLTTLYTILGANDQRMATALEYYIHGHQMGDLLDSESDSLKDASFQVFELEHLMNMGPKAMIPTLSYLFRQIEKRLKGQPTLLVIDEGWIALGNETFRNRIKEWLKVLRKANCAVVLATQSLSDLANSGIVDVLQESCPTKIYLANPQALVPDSLARKIYASFDLNETQISIIGSAEPKKGYFMSTPNGSRLFSLGLGPVALSFVGASGKEDISKIRLLMAEHGENWPAKWLAARGVQSPLFPE